MRIFGVDTSKFQPLGTYDAGAHEIVNIEDPTFEAKVQRNAIEGRPTDAYVWIYSNDRVGDFTTWAIVKAMASGVQRVWADYEEEGVEGNWRLDRFFAACDQLGVPSGYYGNDWRFDHGRYRDRPFWLAGYPDPNDGVWRDHFQPRASRPVQLWQFSSGGGIDRNVVADEAWFAQWVSGTVERKRPKGAEMYIAFTQTRCTLFAGAVKCRDFTGPRDPTFGIPQDAAEYSQGDVLIRVVSEFEMDLLYTASTNALSSGGITIDGASGAPVDPAAVLSTIADAALGAEVQRRLSI